MVGVNLYATWSKTRKENGDILQSSLNKLVFGWISGKFIYLSCCPWSANSFATSKPLFKSHSVDLRVSDISNISSRVKSWIFQDKLENPEEMLLYRPTLR